MSESETESPQPAKAKGRVRPILAKIGLGLLFLLLLLLTLLGLAVGTTQGREWVVAKALPVIMEKTSIDFQVEQLQWPGLGQLQFESLSIALGDGTLIDARKGVVFLDLRALRKDQLLIESLKLNQLKVKLPVAQEKATQENNTAPSSQSTETQLDQLLSQLKSYGSLRLKTLTIGQFELSQTQADNSETQLMPPIGLSAEGSFNYDSPLIDLQAGAQIHFPNSGQTKLSISGDSFTDLKIELAAQDQTEGWLTSLLQLPATEALDAQLKTHLAIAENELALNIGNFTLPLQNDQLSLQGKALINWVDGVYQWQDIILSTHQKQHRSSGSYSEQGLDAKLALNQFPVELIKLYVDIPVAGTISSDIQINSKGQNLGDWQGDGSLSVAGKYQNFPFALNSQINLQDEQLKLKQLKGHFAESQLRGNGVIDLAETNSLLNINITDIQSHWLPKFGIEVPLDHEWAAEVEGQLSGDYLKPNIKLKGKVLGQLAQQALYLSLGAKVTFVKDFSEPKINIANVNLNWGQTQLNGSGTLNLSPQGNSQLKLDLSGLSLAQIKTLDTEALSKQYPALLELHQQLHGDQLANTTLDIVSINTNVSGRLDKPNVDTNFDLRGNYEAQAIQLKGKLNFFNNKLSKVNATLNSELGNIDIRNTSFNIANQGVSASVSFADIASQQWLEWPYLKQFLTAENLKTFNDLALTVNGKAQLTGKASAPVIQAEINGKGSYIDLPLNIAMAAGKATLEGVNDLKVAINLAQDVSLAAEGRLDYAGDADLSMNFQAKPLPQVLIDNLNLPKQKATQIALSASISGDIKNPLIDTQGSYSTTLLSANTDTEETPSEWPVDVQLQLKTLSDRFNLSLNIQDKAEQNLLAQVTLDKAFYQRMVTSPSEQWMDQLPLNAMINGHLALAQVSNLLGDDAHQFTGDLAVDLNAKGTLSNPDLIGDLKIIDGSYTNPILGVGIKDADLELAAKDQAFTIQKGRIKDRNNGRITISGGVNWQQLLDKNSKAENPIDFQLAMRNAQLLQRGDVEASLSGNISAKGDLKRIDVNGDVDITPLAIFLDAIVQNNVAQIEITETGINGNLADNSDQLQVVLNINIDAKQQANIYGKGINAEIGGNIKISGSADSPRVRGSFQAIRGRFDVLGKTFQLDEGQFRIENESMFFNLNGTHTAQDDTEITATVTGTLEKLELNLQSNPALPQDEVISRLLFGKTTGDITPFQAIGLAQTLDQLRTGSSSAFDVVGSTREALGIDSLNVDETQTEDGDTQLNVSIGKYINDKVYLELEPGFGDGESLKGSVEIELTPNVSLESFAGSGSGFGGIELIWKNDY